MQPYGGRMGSAPPMAYGSAQQQQMRPPQRPPPYHPQAAMWRPGMPPPPAYGHAAHSVHAGSGYGQGHPGMAQPSMAPQIAARAGYGMPPVPPQPQRGLLPMIAAARGGGGGGPPRRESDSLLEEFKAKQRIQDQKKELMLREAEARQAEAPPESGTDSGYGGAGYRGAGYGGMQAVESSGSQVVSIAIVVFVLGLLLMTSDCF
ncbi:unnamed protein product [Polarella glacialis]|uniref:Uncharacterized protein n=2 Tax=Polarella glacialis TaxID=89957 RepID=A0A813D3Q3_POLGL|nr:unnamed protein product [Polarella glacialis]